MMIKSIGGLKEFPVCMDSKGFILHHCHPVFND
jgi:hypothetical protein